VTPGRFHAPLLLAACAVVLSAIPASAVAAGSESATTLIPSFRVKATNGFTGFVFAGVSPTTGKGGMVLDLHNRTEAASYQAPARLNGSTLEASFGSLGEVAVTAVPSGHPTMVNSGCGGHGKRVPIETGRWEGSIQFRGEEGFSTIDAVSAKEDAAPLLNLVCAATGSEGIGGHSPGALLTVKRRSGEEKLELVVRKNKPVGPTRLHTQLSERLGNVLVDRSVNAVAPSDALDFEIPPGTAAVEPPAPFSGSLDFTRHGRSPSLKGDLTVDFPGRSSVPILGRGKLAADLVRAVLNPSHPF
jgi:hypothetical protein